VTSGAFAPLGYVVEYGGMAGDPTLQITGDVTVNVVPVNDAPTTNAGGPYTVNEGSSITLSGSGADIDSTIVSYEWDLDYDGVSFQSDLVGQNPNYNSIDGPLSRTIALRVTDDGGATGIGATTLTDNNVAPELTIMGQNSACWVNWTSANVPGGTATGVITLPDGSTINVSLSTSSGGFFGAQTNGGTNFWVASGGAPYISPQVPNPPPDSDIIQLQGGTSTGIR
jgi:hypothetical protein